MEGHIVVYSHSKLNGNWLLKCKPKQPFTTVNQRWRTGGVVGVAVEEVGRARAVGGGGGLAGTESKRESYDKILLSGNFE
jgi:hypothetical protein